MHRARLSDAGAPVNKVHNPVGLQPSISATEPQSRAPPLAQCCKNSGAPFAAGAQIEGFTATTAGRRAHAFARISPAQKLRIVRALQDAGAVVSMVGDGINDSPALRAANVGMAIGQHGDAAAREVADVFFASENPAASSALAGCEASRCSSWCARRFRSP